MGDMQGRGATWDVHRVRLARKEEDGTTRHEAIPTHNVLSFELLVRPHGGPKEIPYAFDIAARYGGLVVNGLNGNLVVRPHAYNQVVLEVDQPHRWRPREIFPFTPIDDPMNQKLVDACQELMKELGIWVAGGDMDHEKAKTALNLGRAALAGAKCS